MISCLSGRPRLFPGFHQLYFTNSFRLLSGQSTLVLTLGLYLQSLSIKTQPLLTVACIQKSISGWKMLVGISLCAEFSPLFVPWICCCTPPLGLQSSTLSPSMCGNFVSVTTPSQEHSFHSNSLVSFFSFVLPHHMENSLPFWNSEVFCPGSVGLR